MMIVLPAHVQFVDMKELTQAAVVKFVEYRVDVYEYLAGGHHSYDKTAWFDNKVEAMEHMNHYNNDDYFAELSIDVKQEDVKE
jgi:hypothetical protein